MTRITLFEPPEDEDAFQAAWRAEREDLGARLLRSLTEGSDFRFTELAGDAHDAPQLPARGHGGRYEIVVDDLPDDAPFDLVFINPYEVAPDEDDEFVRTWLGIRDIAKSRPGYIGSHLYRCVDEEVAFRFVNVSPWSSIDAFTAAVAFPAFAHATRGIYHRAHPSLYVAAS